MSHVAVQEIQQLKLAGQNHFGDLLMVMYHKNFQKPDLLEGFKEIVEVPFRIDPKAIGYTRYLI